MQTLNYSDVESANPPKKRIPKKGRELLTAEKPWLPQKDEKCFGHYRCQCGHGWSSAHSWRDETQNCERCKTSTLAHKQEPLAHHNPEKLSKPHREDLCGKCHRLGRLCTLIMERPRSSQTYDDVFIKGLPLHMTEEDLIKMFRPYGSILRVNLLPPKPEMPARVAFITFQNPESALRKFHDPSVDIGKSVDSKELERFLRLVAEGQQDKAEAMLKKNPDLGFVAGTIKDPSGRIFEGMTAFQYAVWALDWHMWVMLMKYLSPEELQRQAELFDAGPWMSSQGIHAGSHLERVIEALDHYNKNYGVWDAAQSEAYWKGTVGRLQGLLPIHAINEYCYPKRPFTPCPNFCAQTKLPRTRKVIIDRLYEDVLKARWNKGGLGRSFGIYRGSDLEGAIGCDGGGWAGEWRYDQQALSALLDVRIKQRDQLMIKLSNRSLVESVHRPPRR